jgi:hypothetical protein
MAGCCQAAAKPLFCPESTDKTTTEEQGVRTCYMFTKERGREEKEARGTSHHFRHWHQTSNDSTYE